MRLLPEERRVLAVVAALAVLVAAASVTAWLIRRDGSIPFREIPNSYRSLEWEGNEVITDPVRLDERLDELGVDETPPFDPAVEVVLVTENPEFNCPSLWVVDLRYDPDRHRMFPEVDVIGGPVRRRRMAGSSS